MQNIFEELIAQSCLTLHNPMDSSPSGSPVHRILQERIMEWVAIPFSRASSWLRDGGQVSCIAGGFFTVWALYITLTKCEKNLSRLHLQGSSW